MQADDFSPASIDRNRGDMPNLPGEKHADGRFRHPDQPLKKGKIFKKYYG